MSAQHAVALAAGAAAAASINKNIYAFRRVRGGVEADPEAKQGF